MILAALAKNWWALALRGLAAVIFGFLALVWPSLTVVTLALLFGAYAFADGVFSIITGIASRKKNEYWWTMILAGVAGIIIGLVTLLWPGATALVLLYLIAAWAVVIGIFHFIAAAELRRVINNEWMFILNGLAFIIFGIFLVLFPGAGALGLIWAIGIYAIVIGFWMIIFSFRLKSIAGIK